MSKEPQAGVSGLVCAEPQPAQDRNKRLPPRTPALLSVPGQIEPGKLMQNGFIGRFNRSCREGVLDMYVFRTMEELCERTDAWLPGYNEKLSHDSLGDLTSVEYRVLHHPETSGYGWR